MADGYYMSHQGFDPSMEPAMKRLKGAPMGAPKGGPKGGKSSGNPMEEGEVRFYSADCAQRAVQLLDKSVVLGQSIQVALDPHAWDGTKVVVTNMPAGLAWQELKDHFSQAGQVHYANIGRSVDSGKGKPPATEKGSGKGPRSTGDPAQEGEVRFYAAESAAFAAQNLDGSVVFGQQLKVHLDAKTPDGTKIVISNMPQGMSWQDLKDHFSQAGQIHYANIGRTADNGKGKGYGVAQAGQPCVGEVRFGSREEAQQALQLFNEQPFKSGVLTVKPDLSSKAGTKLLVFNVPIGTDCRELKELFDKAGQVEFCGIDCGKSSGKGKGPKGGPSFAGAVDDRGAMAFQGGTPGFATGSMGVLDTGSQVSASVATSAPNGPIIVGEVRFTDPAHAQTAIMQLNGSQLGNRTVQVVLDRMCRDSTRVLVLGLEEGTPWQNLKDHFAHIGPIAFSGLKINGQPAHKYDPSKDSQLALQHMHHPQQGHALQQPLAFDVQQGYGAPMVLNSAGPCGTQGYAYEWDGAQAGQGVHSAYSSAQHGAPNSYASPQHASLGVADGAPHGQGAPNACSSPQHASQGAYGSHQQTSMVAGDGAAMAVGGAAPEQHGPIVGEVRYADAGHAQQAVQQLNSTQFNGTVITVVVDGMCKDGSRVLVMGMNPSTTWRDMRDHFGGIGPVAYAGIRPTGVPGQGCGAGAGIADASSFAPGAAQSCGAQGASAAQYAADPQAQMLTADTAQAVATAPSHGGFAMHGGGAEAQLQHAQASFQAAAMPAGMASVPAGAHGFSGQQMVMTQGYGGAMTTFVAPAGMAPGQGAQPVGFFPAYGVAGTPMGAVHGQFMMGPGYGA
eukprot:CAMPEP_0117510154 /NCGR_PEP_ID=MMETSP0784-20121206/27844_1 /TAXON_ID=39447 /ORGANISM="" /LENGTH=839 /DNA_ID=CAMNT_0005305783 /DNA_START=111 /DNA_END=2626 /DNA_ORIENTATION=+